MKKISCSSKAVLHSCHNFSDGLTLTVSTREKHLRMAWKICQLFLDISPCSKTDVQKTCVGPNESEQRRLIFRSLN